MSEKNSINWRVITNKYLNWKILLTCFILSLLVIPFIFIFISIKRSWADGMSVAATMYIGVALLSIIFKEAKFKTLSKLKNLFQVKKENKEPFTKFEKAQMDVLNITMYVHKNKKHEINLISISIIMLIYGLILLCVSLPFIF